MIYLTQPKGHDMLISPMNLPRDCEQARALIVDAQNAGQNVEMPEWLNAN